MNMDTFLISIIFSVFISSINVGLFNMCSIASTLYMCLNGFKGHGARIYCILGSNMVCMMFGEINS